MINTKRLTERFIRLAETDSPSRHEKAVADMLASELKALGAEVSFDNAHEACGSQTGNLIARIPGTVDKTPLMLSAHMDTVTPGEGVKVVFENGVFRSAGETVLGGDDKSSLAIILEVMQTLIEKDLPRPPVEIVFTVCEEIGLLGAKSFDLETLQATMGYILDSQDTEAVVTNAPFAVHYKITVTGLSAHAGMEPEKGVNAISVASDAITRISCGRIDSETTCNIGKIEGGAATNIVPDCVVLTGEARSHTKAKLDTILDGIRDAFQEAVVRAGGGDDESLPRYEIEVNEDFPGTSVPHDHAMVLLAQEAGKELGRTIVTQRVGGGSDANVFFGKGLMAGVLGSGMTDVHTTSESITLADMTASAELLHAILTRYARQGA
ncbi:M20/M25/M40 family metallo-hydrolase [Desulfoluna sp.]|uniref:M20/M25/M40 family metallo-hydrolase n=1 Tax=Desulfoluna sp. TaxID=2045199 RepID=UPI0026329F5E|nr:M20/M25/M40 family metallo-hydrolase [Desulfoluna sp.]